MGKRSQSRSGSLQFWPRKRITKFLPSVNWEAIAFSVRNEKYDNVGLLGFVGYKVGMASAMVKDLTQDSRTKDKKIIVPVSIIELPPMKIFSVRFYKNNLPTKEVLAENLDKELKRKLKLPKKKPLPIDEIKDYEDIRVIVYSVVKQTKIKKTPDLIEIALSGSLEDKLKFIKEKINKEIFATEVLKNLSLVDIRGLTKGKGLEGPVKRFGISLRQHKSEKGVRRPGSLGPWHPAHVLFRVPMAGQLGMFSRVQYNYKIIALKKISELNINPPSGWKNYGIIKTEFAIIQGSVPGTEKRPLLLTFPLRPSKKQKKKKYEFVSLENES